MLLSRMRAIERPWGASKAPSSNAVYVCLSVLTGSVLISRIRGRTMKVSGRIEIQCHESLAERLTHWEGSSVLRELVLKCKCPSESVCETVKDKC